MSLSVCVIMPTADRTQMTRQAVKCFLDQTYDNKRLLVLDTGKTPAPIEDLLFSLGAPTVSTSPLHAGTVALYGVSKCWKRYRARHSYHPDKLRGLTIGALRNMACVFDGDPSEPCDLIAHFDSDDYSAPTRLAEQVELIESTGADVVGYNEVIFWRDCAKCRQEHLNDREVAFCEDGEAWRYCYQAFQRPIGGSILYRRSYWTANKFDQRMQGTSEYYNFVRGTKCLGVSSIGRQDREPRMICRIHGKNSSKSYDCIDDPKVKQSTFTRSPQFDEICKERIQQHEQKKV